MDPRTKPISKQDWGWGLGESSGGKMETTPFCCCIGTIKKMIKRTNKWTASSGKVVEKREPLCTIGGNADWCSHCGKQYGITSEKFKILLPYDPVILLLGIYLKRPKTLIQKTTSTHIAVLLMIAKICKQPKYPSVMSGYKSFVTLTQWNTPWP